MAKVFKRSLVVLVFLLAVIQFVRPQRTNPPVDQAREITAVHAVSPPVTAVFDRSCNDCHSNRTVWPWYSNVAPASWLVAHDVGEGREALNLSEWAGYNAEKQQKLLSKICEEARDRDMPVLQYTLIHHDARLKTSDVETLCSWSSQIAPGANPEKEDKD